MEPETTDQQQQSRKRPPETTDQHQRSTERPSPPPPTPREPPSPLPDGAWEEWGKDAVYFLTITWLAEDGGEPGLNVFAINPNDDSLPVYLVGRFLSDDQGVDMHDIGEASCAIVGSRVYVVAAETMWYRDIIVTGGDTRGSGKDRLRQWTKGQAPISPVDYPPLLFSLRGNLYALSYGLPYEWAANSFQMLLYGEYWIRLEPPPFPSPDEVTQWDAVMTKYCAIGLSSIGDSKVIVHVPTLKQGRCRPLYRSLKLSDENDFLLFQLKDGSIGDGHWTKLTSEPDWPFRDPFADDPGQYRFHAHRSHLDGGGAPLLLPLLPGKLHAFGGFGSASDSSGMHLECPQEVRIEWPPCSRSPFGFESLLHEMQSWSIFHLGGMKYCAFAFPSFHLDKDQGVFVFVFDLAIGNGGDGDGEDMGCDTTSTKFTARNVRSNYNCCHVGFTCHLLSGKASSSTCSVHPPPRLTVQVGSEGLLH